MTRDARDLLLTGEVEMCLQAIIVNAQVEVEGETKSSPVLLQSVICA